MLEPTRFVALCWMILGAWIGLTTHAGRPSAQGIASLAPGDHRLDTRWVRPYERHYLIEYVPLNETAHVSDHIAGTLTERLEVLAMGGDTVLLCVREVDYPGRDRQIDSLVVARQSLAPIRWRTHRTRGAYQGGLDFRGKKVTHFGIIPEEGVDTTLSRGVFLEGSETLLLPSLLFRNESHLAARVSMLRWVQTDWAFWMYDSDVRFADSVRSPNTTPEGEVWQVKFGGATYWIEKGTLWILQWENPPGEGGFVTRFVAHGR
jgi:hypothetical protein